MNDAATESDDHLPLGGKTTIALAFHDSLVAAILVLFFGKYLNQKIGFLRAYKIPSPVSGGHGTAIAWADVFFEQYGIPNAMEIGIACATFGLVLGGVAGGPVAQWLIRRHRLRSTSDEPTTVGFRNDSHTSIDVDSVL